MLEFVLFLFGFGILLIIVVIILAISAIDGYIQKRNDIKELKERLIKITKDYENKLNSLISKYLVEDIKDQLGIIFYMHGKRYAIIGKDGTTEIVGKIDKRTLEEYFSNRTEESALVFYDNPSRLFFLDLALVDENGEINFISDVEKHIREEFNIPDSVLHFELKNFINEKILEITNYGEELKELAKDLAKKARIPEDALKEAEPALSMVSFTHVSFGLSYAYSLISKRVVKIVAPDKVPIYLRPRMGEKNKVKSELKVETREPLATIDKYRVEDYYQKVKGLPYSERLSLREIIETDVFKKLIALVTAGILNAFDALPSFVESCTKKQVSDDTEDSKDNDKS